MPTLHHVNLSVPPTVGDRSGAEAEADWLTEVMGYRRASGGPDAQQFGTLWWFEADDGHQVHLTVDPDHHPSARAHTAVRLDDALDATLARLRASGQDPRSLTFDGDRHVFASDPAGNLWELIGPPEG
jgi:catechol 2,3-dioxygenase-like lactoylglutathione lyase family enzyme